MKQTRLLSVVSMIAVFAWVGCARVTTHVVEKPRTDQEIRGNRGYLAGASSAPAHTTERKKTRQMIETNVELPTLDELNPWKKPSAAGEKTARAAPQSAPIRIEKPVPARRWEDERPARVAIPAPTRGEPVRPAGTIYTVKKGDSLEKISSKFYGTSRKWRKIYEANSNVIKNPNHLRAGQKIVIPDLEEAAPSRSQRNIK